MRLLRCILDTWPPPALVFFAVFFVAGYLAHVGYGVSSDEPSMMKYGLDTYSYFFESGPVPGALDWKFHSPLVHLVMVIAQKMQGSTMGTDIWFLRHGLSFLMFFATVMMFYRIATRISSDWILPLIGCVFFALTPRLFAHAFYNTKDIPMLLFFTASMLTLLRLRERPILSRILVHALTCALLVSMRSSGLIVVMLSVVSMTLLPLKKPASVRDTAQRLGIYCIAFGLFLIAVWPRLWTNSIGNFLAVIATDTGRSGGTLYMGEMTTFMPWHYVFVWIFITVPVFYSILFVLGNIAFLREALKSPIRMIKHFPDVALFFLWFWLPVAALIVTGTGIFNEWRHLFFIYPGFLLTALLGVQWVFQMIFSLSEPHRKRALWSAIVIGTSTTLWTAGWMAWHHPLQFAYFSVPSSWVRGNFEMDYWGLSYRQGLEYVFAHDKRPQVKVFTAERIAIGSALTLPLEDWQRLNFTSPEEADYILDAFINSNYTPRYLPEKELYSVTVDGLTLLTVYEGPDTEGVYEALPE